MKAIDWEGMKATIRKNAAKNGIYKKSTCRARRIWSIGIKYHFKCAKCGAKDRLTVHHINGGRRRYNSAGDYPIDECILLCFDCHWKAHHPLADR